MAAQLYSNTQLATALFEVLQDLVGAGKLPEELAVATLDQVMGVMHQQHSSIPIAPTLLTCGMA
jgi:hypothetical protein